MSGSPFSAPSSEEQVPTILLAGGIDHATLIRSLEHEGHCVEIAPPGSDVVERAIAVSAALVILDLSGGDAEGLDWCRKLKGDHQARLIPVIALAPQATWDQRMAAVRAGADAVFAQSIEIDRLLHKVDELVGAGFDPESPLVLALTPIENLSTDCRPSSSRRDSASSRAANRRQSSCRSERPSRTSWWWALGAGAWPAWTCMPRSSAKMDFTTCPRFSCPSAPTPPSV